MQRIKDGYLEKVRNVISLTGKNILEIGCGAGARTVKLAEHCASVVAIEPVAELVDQAQKTNARPNIAYRVGTAESLALESGTFDLVIFTLSFHHVPEDKMILAISEAIRVCHKDSHIVFLEPAVDGTFFEAELLFDACDGDERRKKALAYYTMLNHGGLKEVAEFKDVTVFKFDSLDDFVASLHPKKNQTVVEEFLVKNNFHLSAERRINIFSIK